MRASPGKDDIEQTRSQPPVAEDRPRCTSCGSRHHVHTESKLPGVWWCDECWEDAHAPDPRDELGVGD